MTDPITLTDTNLEEVLNGEKPVMLLITNGDGLRGDFKTAFKKAVDEHPDYVVAQIDPKANPKVAERFEIGDKPVMIAWACGEVKARRVRPWGTDVPLAADMLKEFIPAAAPLETEAEADEAQLNADTPPTIKETNVVYDAPVAVTDDTFETEVLASDLPVLVDYWAEWCGPCRMVAPILDKLAAEFAGQVKIAKVDVDSNQGLAQYFRIMSIPTMMAIKDRTIVFNQPGALPEEALRDLIQQLIALEIPPREEEEGAEAESTEESSAD